jgi:hypothetical protein
VREDGDDQLIAWEVKTKQLRLWKVKMKLLKSLIMLLVVALFVLPLGAAQEKPEPSSKLVRFNEKCRMPNGK